jgi:hypothetical protein
MKLIGLRACFYLPSQISSGICYDCLLMSRSLSGEVCYLRQLQHARCATLSQCACLTAVAPRLFGPSSF